MDPQRLKSAWQHLQSLDERLTYRVRPKAGGPLTRPDPERLEQQMRDLANYTVELKEVVHDLILAIGSRPKEGAKAEGTTAEGPAKG